jgi:adenylylsulfate kinase-like enzyme
MHIHKVIPADKPGQVVWFHGNSGSGKSILAIEFKKNAGENSPIILDADDVREVWTDLGFSKKDRYEQNLRIAKLAKIFMIQGFNVNVATICPYADLRREINKILPVKWVYVNSPDSKPSSDEFPFEEGGWGDRK